MVPKHSSEPDAIILRRVRHNVMLAFVLLSTLLVALNTFICGLNTSAVLQACAGADAQLQIWYIRQIPVSIFLLILAIAAAKFLEFRATNLIARHLQLLRDFTQDAGHELATPISIVGTHLQVMDRELSSRGVESTHMPIVLEAIERVSDLVNDFRFLAKAQMPMRQGNLSIMKLDELISDYLASIEPEASSRQIDIVASYSGECGFVGDKEGVSRVVANLVGNALRYCESGNKIKLTLVASDRYLDLVVADDGKGIAEEDLPKVFERFYRSRAAQTQESAGTGLGLAIVKAIVESNGGSISVESQLGKGTTFSLRIPRLPLVHPMLAFLKKDSF